VKEGAEKAREELEKARKEIEERLGDDVSDRCFTVITTVLMSRCLRNCGI
jgi:hypothetical protein